MKRLITLISALTLLAAGSAMAQEYVPTPVTVSKEKVKLNGQVYLSHVVLEKQTIYGIAKAYGVSEQELYQANPTLRETGLQKNAILLIPYRENAIAAPAEGNPQDYTEHTVRWYEDIDDIARKYDLTVKEIMDFNGLKSRKLSTRQVLRIPVKKAVAEEQPAVEETVPETPAPQQADSLAVSPVEEPQPAPQDSSILVIHSRDKVEFSLVLPMKAGSSAADTNMDFYSGVLMAVKDAEAQGTKVQLHVYDLAAGIPPIDALTKSDFVLGPVTSRDLEAILQRVDGQVNVISPLDQKAAALGANYKNFIQAPSAVDNQYEDLAQWVSEDLDDDDRIILVTEKGAASVTASVAIRSAMADRKLEYSILNYAIVEGRGIPTTLAELMTKDGENRIVVASESEAFMGDVVRNLGIMRGKGYKLVMYAPSKVRTFETIEGSAYHDAQLHISTSYHADYSSDDVERFVRTYRALFRTEPSQFAFQGYDTALYFIRRSARFGQAWPRMLSEERERGLHTDFLFRTDAQGNSYNTAVRRIIFEKDYTTTLQ